ncbi:MAG TPA: serine hydrolase [Polyangia bacterium]|jgi:CubicO group peptidase (beta-lactamase class C family)
MLRDFVALRRLCANAVSEEVVPGAVVLVSSEGKTVFLEACGRRQIVPEALPATEATIYDVASVTKAAVTSVLAMQAVQNKLLRLDDPVQQHLPEFVDEGPGSDKGAVTIRQLLAHAGGLAAHRPFYASVDAGPGPERRLEIMRAAAREPLAGPPGVKSLYTDLGFILLGWILERLGGARLDAQARRAIFQPLGLMASMFVDVDAGTGPRPQDLGPVAATERCPSRQRMLVGEVHDLNAFAMGGVAGHAGLFSTAADLAAIAQALVSAWRGDPSAALVDRDVVREFWRPAGIPGSSWRLGWDGPADKNSQAGTLLSRAAVGHLGFTGCSLWIDPARDLIIVLLSNRVHPTVRDDPRFRLFRPAVHDAVLAALD